MNDPATMLIYEQLYRPTDPNDPLPDPDTNSTTRRLWATAGRIRDALTAAGWRRENDTAEEIAQAIAAMRTDHPFLDRRTAAAIARAHRTTPTEEPTDA